VDDLAALPLESRVFEASCASVKLQVGRLFQPLAIWQALLPDEGMQNTVSREHFEIILADDEDAMRLRSFSKAGTYVNRKRVVEYVRVEPGDRISIGAPPHESEAACTLGFRLLTPAYGAGASVFDGVVAAPFDGASLSLPEGVIRGDVVAEPRFPPTVLNAQVTQTSRADSAERTSTGMRPSARESVMQR
jgi:hypothetical protein